MSYVSRHHCCLFWSLICQLCIVNSRKRTRCKISKPELLQSSHKPSARNQQHSTIYIWHCFCPRLPICGPHEVHTHCIRISSAGIWSERSMDPVGSSHSHGQRLPRESLAAEKCLRTHALANLPSTCLCILSFPASSI